MSASTIEWTEHTLNAFVGCRRVSQGCTNCYAERTVHRGLVPQHRGLTVMSSSGPRWNGSVNYVPSRFDEMLRTKGPAMWFINSLSDLFFEPVPFTTIAALLGMIAVAHAKHGHVAQILTKRPERAVEFFEWLRNEYEDPRAVFQVSMGWFVGGAPDELKVKSKSWNRAVAEVLDVDEPFPFWLGVTTENQETADERIPLLLKCPASVHFVSAEPLLGPLDLLRWLPRGETGFSRRDNLSSGPGWHTGDRRAGPDLEGGSQEGRSLESGGHPSVAVQTTESGEQHRLEGVSADSRDARRQTLQHAGAATGVASLQGSYPGGDDDQSSERSEDGQSPGEPGTRHVIGADAPRISHRPEGRTRRDEPGRETVGRGRREDQRSLFDGDGNSAGNSEVAGSRPSDDFEDSQGRQTPTSDRSDGGLHGTSLTRDARQGFYGSLRWVIVGGESGPGAREFDVDWARTIVSDCAAAGVACFVKQLGSKPLEGERDRTEASPPAQAPMKLKTRKGGEMSEWPEDLRVREFPRSL
jgi:protein gp37